jgi:hypothetical protein
MEIVITGLDKLLDRMKRVDVLETVRPSMERSLFRLQAAMADYPPAPAGSWYRRTGTLGRKWTTTPVQRTPDGLSGSIGNNVEYGPLVQSRRFQTRRHRRTGWQTAEDVVEREVDAIAEDFRATVAKALAKV